MIGTRIFSGHPKEEEVGYARAAVVDDWVFVSGTTGFDAQTKQYPDDVEVQCENCFRNIVAHEEDFPKLMPIIRKHCYPARPTNTVIFAKLVLPEMLVEIEAVAKIRR
jgi:enamine deaminase RidA (YjgF/YER057c/UK114 family)